MHPLSNKTSNIPVKGSAIQTVEENVFNRSSNGFTGENENNVNEST